MSKLSRLSNFNKLISFHWTFIKRNIGLWILMSISVLVQLITIIVLSALQKDILDYSLLLFLLPNIFFTILIIYLVYILFQTNKDNSIDDKLLCSKFSKYKIKLARFTLIWIILAVIILVSNLALFYFPITNQHDIGVAVFVSNTFITPFILLLITIIFTFLGMKTSKGLYIFLTILICFLTFGLSLLTRPLLKPNQSLKNETAFYKLISSNDEYLVQQVSEINLLNEAQRNNSFIPSEWFLAPYSMMLNNVNRYSDAMFSLTLPELKEVSDDFYNQLSTLIMIRQNDFNFLSLSSDEYIKLILENIDAVIKKNDLNANPLIVKQTLNDLNSNFAWVDISNPLSISLLKDITGLNTEFNQLYYYIKYQDITNISQPILLNQIKNNFGEDISNLFSTIVTSPSTEYNLFKSNTEFNSTSIYPNFYSVNKFKPILEKDINFLKNGLIKFNENIVSYLNDKNIYVQFDIKILQEFDAKIVDYQTYSTFIDAISNNYETSFDFLKRLKFKIPNLFSYDLSPNSIDEFKIINAYKYVNSNNLYYPEIFTGLIIFFNMISNVLFFVNINRKEK